MSIGNRERTTFLLSHLFHKLIVTIVNNPQLQQPCQKSLPVKQAKHLWPRFNQTFRSNRRVATFLQPPCVHAFKIQPSLHAWQQDRSASFYSTRSFLRSKFFKAIFCIRLNTEEKRKKWRAEKGGEKLWRV